MNNNQILWQQYVDVFIGQKCKDALIFNKADGSKSRLLHSESGIRKLTPSKAPWAASKDFGLKSYKGVELKEDGSEVPADIDEEEGFIEFAKSREKPRHGFCIGETKYQLLRSKL